MEKWEKWERGHYVKWGMERKVRRDGKLVLPLGGFGLFSRKVKSYIHIWHNTETKIRKRGYTHTNTLVILSLFLIFFFFFSNKN